MSNLAINGGTKTFEGEFPMWPSFEKSTIEKAMQPLREGRVNYWTGLIGREFENKWAEWIGAAQAISVANGTAALHTAVASLGIGPGDEIICPSYSFIAYIC